MNQRNIQGAEHVILTRDHLPELARFCSANLPLDPFTSRLIERTVFDDPRCESGFAGGLVDRDEWIALAVGTIWTTPEAERHGWVKLLAVDGAHRRRGLGTHLLAWLERRFGQAGAVQVDTAAYPYYFWPGVDVRYTPACCLFERCGYVAAEHHVNMTLTLQDRDFDTSADEARIGRDGFKLLRTDAETLPAVREFIRPHWPAWADEVVIAAANEPVSLFHVSRDGRAVAFAAYDAAMFPGSFGPTATDPALQGRGLGTILLKRCLHDMQAIGYERCEMAWVGPVGFYADKLGATIHRVFRPYHKRLA